MTKDVRDEEGSPVQDGTFLLLFNAHFEPVPFVLPGLENVRWDLMFSTEFAEGFLGAAQAFDSGAEYVLKERCLSLFRFTSGIQEHAASASWKKRAAPSDGKK